jgi:hypothetical protein
MEKPKPIQWKGGPVSMGSFDPELAKVEALRVIAQKLHDLEHSVSLFVSTQIAADVPFPPRPAAIRPNHTKDEDCDVDPKTSTCRVCGVGHMEPRCVDCGKLAFHADGCPESRSHVFGFVHPYEPVPAPEDAQRLAVKSAALSDVRAILDGLTETKVHPGSGLSRILFEVETILSVDLGNPVWSSPNRPDWRRS